MEQFINHSIITPLLIGFVLDCLLGDPRWLPHPIRWYGKLINFGERKINRAPKQKIKGAFFASSLIIVTFLFLSLFLSLFDKSSYAYIAVTSIIVFFGLANHSLIKEALKVERKLNTEGIESARKQLSFIVGRDTSKLTANEIRIAILETLAENLSDGVVAPLFYYAIGGVPLMLTYKMINTLDSMIGYKNDRYKDFGWFAAKTDDVFNYIPARITAFLMSIITFNKRAFTHIVKYGKKHSSPNAGYPEAALSGILNTRFGGPNIYHGKFVDKPYIGTNNRQVTALDIYKSCILNFTTSLIFMAIIIYLFILFK